MNFTNTEEKENIMEHKFSKMTKAILNFALIVTCATPLTVSAKNGDMNGLSDEGEIYIRSEEYKNKIKKKTEWVENQSKMSLFRSPGVLGVPHYKQEQGTWCGPASMQMVVHYVTGTYYSQASLASVLGTGPNGTYIDVLANQLHAYTGLAYEVGLTSQGNFYNNVKADFDANYPVVYDVDASYLDPFYQGFTPHFVVGVGYSSNGSLHYSDPFKDSDYLRTVSQSTMIQALNGNGGYYVY